MEEKSTMSFLDHLEELRWRLVRAAIAVLIFTVFLWMYQEWIIENIFLSMKNANFITYRYMCSWFGVCTPEIPVKMQSTTMAGQFSYALMMSIMGGLVLAFPYVFYQIWFGMVFHIQKCKANLSKSLITFHEIFARCQFFYFFIP